ncbi:MAG: hypothetical protein AB9861_06110 [Methanosarcina sp.]|jgi:hypothetical protein
MRFKVLAAEGLILLGIVVFSVYSGSSNESLQDEKSIIQKIEVNNNSFLEVPEYWDGFETVIVDTDKLRKAADNGQVTLSLMGEEFEVRIQEASRQNGENGENAYFYTGSIVGRKQSRAELYIEGEIFHGSVELGEPWNVTYNIAHTDERYNGKIVHVMFMIDWEKERERLEQEEIDPLQFFLINSDSRKHVISIEIFDFNNKSIFKETYTIDPEEEISSPKIDAELGQYRYEIILDNESTFEQKVQADHATNLCSSEKLHINLIDHPEYPMEIGIEVA